MIQWYFAGGFSLGAMIATAIGIFFSLRIERRLRERANENHDLYMEEFMEHGKVARLHLQAKFKISKLIKSAKQDAGRIETLRNQLAAANRKVEHAKDVGYVCNQCKREIR